MKSYRRKLIVRFLVAGIMFSYLQMISTSKAEVSQDSVLQAIIEGAKHNESLIKTMKVGSLSTCFKTLENAQGEIVAEKRWQNKQIFIKSGVKERLEELFKWDPESSRAESDTVKVFDGEKEVRWFRYPDEPDGVIIEDRSGLFQHQRPSDFGRRIFARPISIVLEESDPVVRSAISEISVLGEGTIEGHTCKICNLRVEGKGKGQGGELKIWIDPKAGYCIRRMEEYVDGRLTVLVDFVELQEFPESIWYPVKGRQTMFGYENGVQVSSLQTSMEVTQGEFNKEIPDSVFTLDLPPGTRVDDKRTGVRYIVGEAP